MIEHSANGPCPRCGTNLCLLRRYEKRGSGRRKWLLAIALGVIVLAGAEGYRAFHFYRDVSTSRTALLSIKSDLDLQNLEDSNQRAESQRAQLEEASAHLKGAKRFVRTDPFLAVVKPLPVVGKQAKGLQTLVLAADEAARTGLAASEVSLAFASYDHDPNKTSIEQALAFLQAQEESMAQVSAGYQRLQAANDQLPDGLIGPMAHAKDELQNALDKLQGLVDGYQRADALLPTLLGFQGTKRYLVLPQNDTELFPSGGLISSYGIATFEQGRLTSMNLEYFGTLFDRWQAQSHGEYVPPPDPLKNYLLRNVSWGLGEAGWYPDFPKTADLAREFVAKGGAPDTDGTIAMDLQFISALLDLLGPVEVPEYGVTVTSSNVGEITLQNTREEGYVPGENHRAFLSFLARSVLNEIYAVPKDRWVPLLSLLDREAKERHLQLNFEDAKLQSLVDEYGFDGRFENEKPGDFLMLADTSVNSTKLNMILQTHAQLDVQLDKDGSANTWITYQIRNPFPEWKTGRDPKLVSALMLQGVYGCYLRIYTSKDSQLLDVQLNGKSAGAEQNEPEMERRVFGRFFPVLPGATATAQFLYQTPAIAQRESDGLYHYRLYVQKQAGTSALPLDVQPTLPEGAQMESMTLDGKAVRGNAIHTDLRRDRQIDIAYRQ